MSRIRKIALIVAASVVGLIVVVIVAGLIVVHTPWFRNTVREKIVSAVETGTGGRAEIGSFTFEVRHLRAEIRNFVIHGLEPATAAPLFRANLVQVDLKLTSPFEHFVDIAYLLVDTPQANIIVYPDGHTNVPSPKTKSTSNKSGLETVVDLAIGRFDLRNGSATFAERKSDFNASGEKLRAQLTYDSINPGYSGEVDISPLYLKSGNNQSVDVTINLPVTLKKDTIALSNARLSTPQSEVLISGTVNHLKDPQTSGHVNARIALDEVKRVAALSTPLDTAHGPRYLNADVTASMGGDRIEVQDARINLGQTAIQAGGTLEDPSRPGSLHFNASIAVGELGRLLRVSAQPEGTVRIAGNATLRPNNNYFISAKVKAPNLGFNENGTRIAGISLDSDITADPNRIDVSGLRLAALGGSLTASGAVENMERFHVSGDLHNFDIDRVMRAFSPNKLGYDGVVSGPIQAEGDLKSSSDLIARANLTIAPGGSGSAIPLSGRLAADYNGRADTVTISRSFLQLPHTRADISGSLGQRIQLHLVSRDFSDFKPVASIPVTFHGGAATVDATVSGKLSDPHIAGQIGMTDFAVEGRQFTRLDATVGASKSGASVNNASLSGPLQAQFSGSVGLRDWKPENDEPLRVDATISSGDVRDVLALAGQANPPVTGALTANAHISGAVGDPRGNADFTVSNGTIQGDHFDNLSARASMSDRSVDVQSLQFLSGGSRVDANASYQHPPNNLKQGTLRAHVASNQIQLADFKPVVKGQPTLHGAVTINADALADLREAASGEQFELRSLNANAAGRGLTVNAVSYGDFTATAQTAGSELRYDVNSNFAGSTIRVNGQSQITGNYATTATAQVSNLPIQSALAVAGQNLPVAGTLAANAQVDGTLNDPHVNATFNIRNGSAYQEKFNQLEAEVRYSNQLVDIPSLRLVDGPSNIQMSASLAHPAGDYQQGQLRFNVKSNQIQLANLAVAQQYKAGIAGVVQLAADGAATLRKNDVPLFSTLNANFSAKGLSVEHKPVGDVSASAETRGRELDFQLTSDFGHSNIRGNGKMQLTGDYPLDARLTFSNLTYSGLSNWTGEIPGNFDASAAGEITVNGPAARTADLRGTARLTTLEAHSVIRPGAPPTRVNMQLRNQGDLVLSLDRSIVKIQNFRIAGPGTTLAVTGSAPLGGVQPVDIHANGDIQMNILEAFSPDIFSAGNIVLNAAVTGTTSKPAIKGDLQLRDVSFNMMNAPNGLSNANGTIAFTGTEAVIQNLTAQSGGGKITLGGIVGYGGPELRVRLQATADKVHIDYPENVTTQASAKLALEGTTSRSLLSGNVTIEEVAMHSHSDIGSILTSAAAPPSSPTESTGFVGGIRFDVKIQTAPGIQVHTTLAENLQLEANLTLRGTVDHPGMLGRAAITSGEVVFFGSKYTVDQGTLVFNNPQKINPIINIDLETTAQGVDVAISVSGPMDRLKLSYRSDPPMEFSDLVSLLASGKPPTTDPVLAAHTPPAPQQSFEQAGASTLLGQAVATPISGRLQRLFGVSKLKINPEIVGTSNTPQATMTLQQQITHDITFTYIQNITQTNPLGIRIEWAINPQWSAIAQRDEFGIFDLDFFYKRRFR